MTAFQEPRRRERSATITPTLLLTLGAFGLLAAVSFGAQPGWWNTRDAVMTEQVVTNSGVVTTNYVPNDYAVATQGQLKQFTARAVDELNVDLTNGAGPALSNLVYGWQQDYLTNGYATNTANLTRPYKASDLEAVNVGQLKTVANLIYGRLSAIGFTNLAPAWLPQNTNSDNAVAVIGQMKQVFNFGLTIAAPSNLVAVSKAPGTVNLSWIVPTGNTSSWVVEEQKSDGSWMIVTTLTNPSANSYTISGLNAGNNYTFQVFASSPYAASLPVSVSNSASGITIGMGQPLSSYAVLNIITDITHYPELQYPCTRSILRGELVNSVDAYTPAEESSDAFNDVVTPFFKITDSGFILVGTDRFSPNPLSMGAPAFALQHLGPNQSGDGFEADDIAENGTVVGAESVQSTYQDDQATWTSNSITATIVPITGSVPAFNFDVLTDDNHDIWTTQDFFEYTLDGGVGIYRGCDGVFNGSEMGYIASGTSPSYDGFYGPQIVPLAVSRYGAVLTQYTTFLGPASGDASSSYANPQSYFLGTNSISFTPIALDNSGAVVGYTSATNSLIRIPTTNGGGTVFSLTNASPPIAVGTTQTTLGGNTFQVLGPNQSNISSIWTYYLATNAFDGGIALNNLISTNTGYSNITGQAMNDGGAIVGTATYSPTSGYPTTNIVMLIPDSITRDGQTINATNNTVCVGQQINLTNMISGVPTNAITSYQWNIPGATNGTAFVDYEPNVNNSNYTNLAPSYLTNNYCNFYLSAGGTNQVSCTTVIYGQTNTVSATLNVLSPTNTSLMATNQWPIGVSTNYVYAFDTNGNPISGLPWLCYGLNRPGQNGIYFTQTNSAPSGFAGTNEWVQVINSDYITNTTSAGPQPHSDTGGCDTTYPYRAVDLSGAAYDDPGDYLLTNCVSVSRNFTATMYLMWQPYSTNAAVNGDNTVWVPLRSYQWNWNGTATNVSPTTNNGTGWGLASSRPPNSTATNIATTNEPTWSTNAAANWNPPF